MKKVGIYLYSARGQDDIDSQLQAIEVYLDTFEESEKPHTVKFYKDIISASSSKSKKRVQYQQMIQDAANGDIDTIICYSIEKFSKSSIDLLKTILDLSEQGTDLLFVKQRYMDFFSDKNPFRSAILPIVSKFLEVEKEMISSSTKAGLAEAKANGKRLGNKPLSVKKVSDIREKLRAGKPVDEIMRAHNVSESSVYRIKRGVK